MTTLTRTLVNLAATSALGSVIAAGLEAGDRILLSGELGSGKTTLARAIGAALHAEPSLTSPTFALVSEHRGDLPIWHIDAYRLAIGSNALQHGLIDNRQSCGVTIIEWPEHLTGLDISAEETLSIHLATAGDGSTRSVVVTGAREALLNKLAAWFNPQIAEGSGGERG